MNVHVGVTCMLIAFIDLVTAVPRYDDNTYTGRVNVYNPPDFDTIIQSVDAQGSQVIACCTALRNQITCSCQKL